MKKANNFLRLGIIGATVTVVILLLLEIVAHGWQISQYTIPWTLYLTHWIVFIIIGLAKRKHAVKQD